MTEVYRDKLCAKLHFDPVESGTRLEIYLPDSAKPAGKTPPALLGPKFAALEEQLATVREAAEPAPEDRAWCWRIILAELPRAARRGRLRAAAQGRAVCFSLSAAPFLGDSKAALKRNFNRKLALAAAGGIEAVTDQRTVKSGWSRRPADWEFNIQLFAQHTLTRHGRESQAWRELMLGTTPNREQFTESFRKYYPFDARSRKSQVPCGPRAAIHPLIAAVTPHQLGPRAARLARPALRRDWSDTAAGDFYTQDDVTINHLWFEWHEFGEYEFDGRRFNVGRGQWLICCDERTDFPLGFMLLPTPTYDRRAICTLNARLFSKEEVGLPFRGMK